MHKSLRVLMVEDSEGDAELLLRLFRESGYTPDFDRVDNAEAMRAALACHDWDIVVSDHRMPQFSAPEALAVLHESGLDLPFIVVSGSIGEATAVEAMKAGAHDYLMKDNLARLIPVIERELREAANRAGKRRAAEALRESELRLCENQEQLRIAREIQQHLFPKSAPVLPQFDIAGVSRPADATGGDYFDYLPMLDGRLGLIVGDVTGHGVGPALLMAETRAYLRLLSMSSDDLGQIMTRANAVIAPDVGPERFVTILLVQLDPASGTLRFVNAGHPPGHILSTSSSIRTTLKRSGLPLGIRLDTKYTASPPLTLTSGEIVVLLTDGLEEAIGPDGHNFGLERVFEIVHAGRESSAREIVESLLAAFQDFLRQTPQEDDVTIIVAKVR